MDQSQFVDVRAFAAAFSALMKFHQSSMDHFSALLASLVAKKILTPDDWLEGLRALRMTEESKAVWKKIEELEKMLETQSIADMLKDFSGPIQ